MNVVAVGDLINKEGIMIQYLPHNLLGKTNVEVKIIFVTPNELRIKYSDTNGEISNQIFTVTDLKHISNNKVVICVSDKPPYVLSIIDANVIKNENIVVLFDLNNTTSSDFRDINIYFTDDVCWEGGEEFMSMKLWNSYNLVHKILFVDDSSYEWIFPFVSKETIASEKLTSEYYGFEPTSELPNEVVIKLLNKEDFQSIKFKICSKIYSYGELPSERHFESYPILCIVSSKLFTLTPNSTMEYSLPLEGKGLYKILPGDAINHRVKSIVSDVYNMRQASGFLYYLYYEGLLPFVINIV